MTECARSLKKNLWSRVSTEVVTRVLELSEWSGLGRRRHAIQKDGNFPIRFGCGSEVNRDADFGHFRTNPYKANAFAMSNLQNTAALEHVGALLALVR